MIMMFLHFHSTFKSFIILLTIAKIAVQNDDFHQSSYKAVFQRANVLWVDKEVITIAKIDVHKFNRTTNVASMALKTNDVVQTARLEYIFYKLLQNEYKRTGIQSSFDLCKALKHNYYGLGIIKKMTNVSNCPVPAGTYKIDNFMLESEKLPPLIPGGDYKGTLTIFANSKKIAVIEGYGSIIYPPLWRH